MTDTEIPYDNRLCSRFSRYSTPEKEGAGVLLVARDTGRILALQGKLGAEWVMPAGKKLGVDKKPLHCALRELTEKTGYNHMDSLRAVHINDTSQLQGGLFRFHTFVAVTD